MKNIGSKMAAKLAREKFGERAFVARSGKVFYVGTFRVRFWRYLIDQIHGRGRSWELALLSAGVQISDKAVIPPVVPDEVKEDQYGEVTL